MTSLNLENEKTDSQILTWEKDGEKYSSIFHTESGMKAPPKVILVDDSTKADFAFQQAMQGTGLLWQGDFQNAKQLLQALMRRYDKKTESRKKSKEKTPAEVFHVHRLHQSQRARFLNMLLIPIQKDGVIPLRRAPNIQQALIEAGVLKDTELVTTLRDLLGIIGAHEWRKNGIAIPELGNEKIYPHYGVFSPVRGEYLELVLQAPLPNLDLAFDIGTGTGVLAAILAKRGIQKVIATDLDPRAIECASKNIQRLGLQNQIEIQQTNLFPEGLASLVLCNPPWLPAKPSSPIENAIYDFENRMLKGFLAGLASHLKPEGEGWLIISDLAEHLGLRTREELLNFIEQGKLQVLEKHDIKPRHRKAQESTDALAQARRQETTSLWRLGKK